MTAETQKVLNEALALPENERVRLAAELLASIDEAVEDDVAAAWAAEIERREAEALAGRGESRDWRTALDDIERRVLGR